MENKLTVVFGLPGAGKTYVADTISEQYGYFSFNGDEVLPNTMRNALFNKEIITDAMRHEFAKNMIDSIRELLSTHHNVVVHQTFLKDFMRRQILDAFPYARFILVATDNQVRETRYQQREYFNLGIDYLRHMSSLFEPPSIPFFKVTNTLDGPDHLKPQLKEILSAGTT